MSCTAYVVYKFQLSLQRADFGQFKAERVFFEENGEFGGRRVRKSQMPARNI